MKLITRLLWPRHYKRWIKEINKLKREIKILEDIIGDQELEIEDYKKGESK